MNLAPDPSLPGEMQRVLTRVAAVVTALATVVSLVLLAGWAAGAQRVVRILSVRGFVAPLTAALILVLSAGILVTSRAGTPGWRRTAGRIAGSLVAAAGLTVFAEHPLHRDLGIDRLLFPARVGEWYQSTMPGRPSPHTALAFVLLGLGLALLDAGADRAVARLIVPASVLVAGLAALGQAYGLAYLAGSDTTNGMAPTTAVLLVLCSVGMLLSRPDRPPVRIFISGGVGGTVVRRLGAACGLAVVVIAVVLVVASRSTGGRAGFAAAAAVTLLVGALYAVLTGVGEALDRAGRDHDELVGAVRAERDLTATVLRSLRDGVFMIDPQERVIDVSPRWCEITGYEAGEAIGRQPPFPWWPPNEYPLREQKLANLVAGGPDREMRLAVRRADGTSIEVMAEFAVVRNDDGSVRMVIGSYRDMTDYNRIEGERRRSADQLDDFFDLSGDLMCIAGVDGRFRRLNRAWQSMLGRAPDALLGRPFVEFVHPDDVAGTIEQTARAVQGVPVVGFENRYRCRDGSYRVLSWKANLAPGGQFLHAVARDITETREAEEARAWNTAIVSSTADAVIGSTLDGVVVSWNAAAERMYGYRPGEIIGQPMYRLWPPDLAGEVERALAQVSTGTPVERIGSSLRHRGGSDVNVDVRFSPIRDGRGDIIGAATVATDISARQAAEDRFRRLVRGAPDAMVITDSAGVIVEINEQTERMFGYDAIELLGRRVEILVPERLRDRHIRHRQHFLGRPTIHGMGIGLALNGRRKDGSEFPIEVSLAPLALGQDALVSAAIRDVTDRRQAEQDLAKARDDALAAAEIKSQFVATVSHEIRTPMNGVLGLTGLLMDTPLAATQRRYVEAIRASGRALLTIINDILDFSKIESGKLELVLGPIELRSLVEEITAVAAELARDKEVEVVCSYPPSLPRLVEADGGRLRQALLNLVGNAVKFSERGQVLVSADLAGPDAEHGCVVRFAVNDTGIGIAAQDLQRLLEPFVQADTTVARRYEGTGLGLSICRSLVELMGGQLDISSELGRGSTFSFAVPLRRLPDADPHGQPDGDPLAGHRLLVMDGNPTTATMIAEHSRAWGMHASVAGNGAAVLDELRAAAQAGTPFDVALIDPDVPGTNGVHLLDAIERDPVIPPTMTIMLTAGSYHSDRLARTAGAVDVLAKPMGMSQLYDCLRRVLSGGDGTEPALPAANTAVDRGLVLVAEDNDINQMVAVDTLATLGYRADVAANGVEAVRMAATGEYRAVLMDCQMPMMDGFQATAELRRQAGTRHTPVIAMTASALIEDRQRCLDAGMDDFIAKPIDPAALDRVLERWIDAVPPAGEPAAPAQPPGGIRAIAEGIDDRLSLLRNGAQPVPEDLASRLVAAVRDQVPASLARIDAAVRAADSPTVATLAHDLIGVAGNIGADELATECAHLQFLAGAGDMAQTAAAVAAVRAAFGRTEQALDLITV